MSELGIGEIQFDDGVVPALPAGDYLIDLQQSAVGDGVDGTFAHQQPLRVTGPHLGLGAGDVVAVQPPAGSAADYTETLPSVVLASRELPWQIPAGGDAPAGTPWLALLLLHPEEVLAPPPAGEGAAASPTGAFTVSVADYLAPPADRLGPSLDPTEVAELEQGAPDRGCTVVDVVADAFTAVAPTAAELALLVHTRQVDTGDQEILGVRADGWFSVVIGSRLAQGSPTGVYVAHLVSVEGFVDALPPHALPERAAAVRLLSLASWTFNGLPAPGSFAGLMRGLDVGLLALPPLLPTPADDEERQVAAALAGGYVPLAYATRLGETTVGWYRGPCLPVLMADNPQPPFASAEAGLVYDPATGVFDTSYAVAWQTGRLILLANRQVTSSLLAWVRRQHRTAHLLLQRVGLVGRHPDLGLPEDADALHELVAPDLVRRHARRHLASRLGRSLGSAAAEPALGPPVDPSGLRRHLGRVPGLLDDEAARALRASGEHTTAALVAHLRGEER